MWIIFYYILLLALQTRTDFNKNRIISWISAKNEWDDVGEWKLQIKNYPNLNVKLIKLSSHGWSQWKWLLIPKYQVDSFDFLTIFNIAYTFFSTNDVFCVLTSFLYKYFILNLNTEIGAALHFRFSWRLKWQAKWSINEWETQDAHFYRRTCISIWEVRQKNIIQIIRNQIKLFYSQFRDDKNYFW